MERVGARAARGFEESGDEEVGLERRRGADGDGLVGEPDVGRRAVGLREDGDRPEKAEFCQRKGIEYRVLKRLPKPGLPKRASTALRGY